MGFFPCVDFVTTPFYLFNSWTYAILSAFLQFYVGANGVCGLVALRV
jgi:hypothetical protein